MQDGENILGEFLLGAVTVSSENHDLSAVSLNLPFDEVEPEPGKAVLVGNHKPELISAVQPFQ